MVSPNSMRSLQPRTFHDSKKKSSYLFRPSICQTSPENALLRIVPRKLEHLIGKLSCRFESLSTRNMQGDKVPRSKVYQLGALRKSRYLFDLLSTDRAETRGICSD